MTRPAVVAWIGVAWMAWVWLGAAPVDALNLIGQGDGPVDVVADDGIEWQQNASLLIARGNAQATRGDVFIQADELRAYYRQNGAGIDLYRLTAVGNVTIRSPREVAYGARAVYEADRNVLTLSGGPLRLVAENGELTATERIEYWERKGSVVARGNASVIQGDRRLKADRLVAHLEQANGVTYIHRVDAYDQVEIKTRTETAFAERGVYEAALGMATLTGSVKLASGNNWLSGCKVEIDLKTNNSRLSACANQRTRGVFVPGGRRPAAEKTPRTP